jgi:hypothetical protein
MWKAALQPGTWVTGSITSKQLTFSGNQIHDLNATINTTPQGLQFAGNIAG